MSFWGWVGCADDFDTPSLVSRQAESMAVADEARDFVNDKLSMYASATTTIPLELRC